MRNLLGARWRARLPGQPACGFVGGNALSFQVSQKAPPPFPRLTAGIARGNPWVVFPARREPHRSQNLIETGPHRWVRNPKLDLDVLDDAAVLDEDLDKGELFGGEALEASELK